MDHPAWIITPEELALELKKPKNERPILLDVRELEEWVDSRLEGCHLIPMGELMERVPKELTLKQADIVIYCAHGIRSMHALRALQMMGYLKLRSLIGGICAWEDEGRDVLRGNPE